MTSHEFGGSWTEDKLARVRKYLAASTTALKNQPFQLMYVDAFAGTGYRSYRPHEIQPEFDFPEFRSWVMGSASIAMEITPRFHSYIFIERNRKRLLELRRNLEARSPDRLESVTFDNRDANEAIADICRTTRWRSHRAVLFLDPYGMQVDWSTIEAVAATKSIDMWYLFPSHIGVGRMMPRQTPIPETWSVTLDRCLGDTRWREVFFREQITPDLFGDDAVKRERLFDTARVESYFRGRLQTIFAGVSKHALPIENQRRVCMYMLFFACGNPRGRDIALRIADHILKP